MLPLQGAQVGSLVRELRSCMPCMMWPKQNKTQQQQQKSYVELNKNENITYQNLWDVNETLLRG